MTYQQAETSSAGPAAKKPTHQDGAASGAKKTKTAPATTTPSGQLKSPRKSRSFAFPLRALTRKGPPGGFDDTPLPDAPQAYTVRFTFEYAKNLPPSDFRTASSDPFLTATLRGTQPKRHKEDPDLVYRTRTLRRTTEPEWKSEWTVANVPPGGFSLKCRMYDEDYPDRNDRLGNVTVKVSRVFDQWEGMPPPGREFNAKKRMISKRAFILKTISGIKHHSFDMTPRLCISMEVLGASDPPYAQMCTIGPSFYFKHFSPMIGRLITGTKVNRDSSDEPEGQTRGERKRSTQKYDFQANEMQLRGPVPSRLYHRYVEFKPIISYMFNSKGLRGKVLNAALHKQHHRVYNFDKSTQYDSFESCTEEASLTFLRLAHFDEGGRIFTYVLTLDGLLRFTETGKEFGIDLLSKHTMHSDVATYIACSGEFLIRRTKHPHASDDPQPDEKTHPEEPIPGGPPESPPPGNPAYYQLIIDNDSGTYRPDKRILPLLKDFLEKNFPGMGIVVMDCGDERLKKLKEKQTAIKKSEGRIMNVVMNNSQSSISSAESDLDDRDGTWQQGQPSKREAAYATLEDPAKLKAAVQRMVPGGGRKKGESSQGPQPDV
ncbi:uncharacterized protein J7T54_007607 [Emericellopsis cladophorae]|uniref:C2 domain-containing protein n=1 Tax=Emericellopsis cladophorae TaxID=2686198 RepID=A0A9P9XUA8_9HYPO|nr:uncharacterized protein J7T54_007607 [Emericellopsis cladophorae]KAI6777713.1 hypothetical protein J7T54_007607 [Emericellopsis cladophorae]